MIRDFKVIFPWCRLVYSLALLLALSPYQPLYADPIIPINENIVTVYDAEIDQALPGVTVFSPNRDFSTSTNAKGQVDISGLLPQDTLTFSFISFENLTMSVNEIRANFNRVYLKSAVTKLGEVVVYGYNKAPQRSEDIPPIVEVIKKDKITLKNPQTSADMLANTGSVFVQKSQMGGGSPIIRGFEANKLLIVLDGVRMNNAIYRAGHLQNVLSIDNSILDKTEIIYGPASVIYGSDALGGVLHFYTKKPNYLAEGDKKIQGEVMSRFASANLEKTLHFDLNYSRKKFATMFSVSASDFDDLRAGSFKGKHQTNGYGEREFYSELVNGQDSVITNPRPLVQVGTAYSRLDFVQKTRFKPHKYIDLMLNLQYSTTTNVPRYDQLTEGELLVDSVTGERSFDFDFGEWNYGPQSRFLAALSANIKSFDNMYDDVKLIASFQKINEDRITRNFGDNLRNQRKENVYVYALNADLSKQVLPKLKVLYGAEITHNQVFSEAYRENIFTQVVDNRLATRYPDGGSSMTGFALYANTNTSFDNGINLMGGLRYSYITLSAQFIDTLTLNAPYKDGRITLETPALTGSLGFTWDMGKDYHLHVVASNAFRAPNVDDVGKIRSKNGFVILPTTDSDGVVAEKSLNAEMSLAKTINNKVKLSGTYFYTYLFDAIVQRQDTLPNGQATIYYDGNQDSIRTNINAGEALIWGTSATLLVSLTRDLTLRSSVNYTFGHNISDDRPMAHIPPLYGMINLDYQRDKLHFQFVTHFNGWKRLARYSGTSSDNLDQATAAGTPPWYTLNLYTSYELPHDLKLTFGVENILDRHYRPFSSGVSAAGVNFMLGLHGNF